MRSREVFRTWAQWRMVNSLLLATFLRTCLVVISYGCKVPAGIFVPSMAVGATFGRMVGILVKALYRCVFCSLSFLTQINRADERGPVRNRTALIQLGVCLRVVIQRNLVLLLELMLFWVLLLA